MTEKVANYYEKEISVDNDQFVKILMTNMRQDGEIYVRLVCNCVSWNDVKKFSMINSGIDIDYFGQYLMTGYMIMTKGLTF
jgi:hypothetical protein